MSVCLKFNEVYMCVLSLMKCICVSELLKFNNELCLIVCGTNIMKSVCVLNFNEVCLCVCGTKIYLVCMCVCGTKV